MFWWMFCWIVKARLFLKAQLTPAPDDSRAAFVKLLKLSRHVVSYIAFIHKYVLLKTISVFQFAISFCISFFIQRLLRILVVPFALHCTLAGSWNFYIESKWLTTSFKKFSLIFMAIQTVAILSRNCNKTTFSCDKFDVYWFHLREMRPHKKSNLGRKSERLWSCFQMKDGAPRDFYYNRILFVRMYSQSIWLNGLS